MEIRKRVKTGSPENEFEKTLELELLSAWLELSECINDGLLEKCKIGNDTDYVEIDNDGELSLNGDATVWDDLRVSANSVKAGGAAPGFETFSGNLKTFLFDKSGDEEVHFNVQIPHSYKEGSSIYPHVHWAPMDTDTGDVVWALEYTWANIDGTFGATTTITISDDADGTALKHQMASFAAISGTGKEISSMLVCRLYRDVSADDYNNDAAFLEFDIHFEIDTIGSKTGLSK